MALALVVAWAGVLGGPAAGQSPAPPAAPAPEPPPGVAAPPEVVAEIHRAVADAVRRFEAMDLPGVLAHVSERYRTGPLTRPIVAEQLRAVFAVHDAVRARVRLDDVRLVGDHAWIYSTGEVTGRLRWIGQEVSVLWWERELEVARREDGRWRLYGYQQ